MVHLPHGRATLSPSAMAQFARAGVAGLFMQFQKEGGPFTFPSSSAVPSPGALQA